MIEGTVYVKAYAGRYFILQTATRKVVGTIIKVDRNDWYARAFIDGKSAGAREDTLEDAFVMLKLHKSQREDLEHVERCVDKDIQELFKKMEEL